jgi:hypothetical protein
MRLDLHEGPLGSKRSLYWPEREHPDLQNSKYGLFPLINNLDIDFSHSLQKRNEWASGKGGLCTDRCRGYRTVYIEKTLAKTVK